VRDTYTVERLLGEGAFAEAYRVRHRFLGRQAMKVFKAAGATLADIERDLAEALLLSRLKHPNIIEVFDANILPAEDGPHGYFTMTYMPAGTLDRHWRSYGVALMPVAEAVRIVTQVCRGLAAAHAAAPPIVHRDIKPQNILLELADGGLNARLSDFGLARHANPMTLLISAKGTLGFKPPESLHNIDSCAADVWAMGVTLYMLLTDHWPYPQLNQRDVGEASAFLQPLRPASVYNVNVDAALDALTARCLSVRAADRYADAGELLKDLERWTAKPAGAATVQV